MQEKIQSKNTVLGATDIEKAVLTTSLAFIHEVSTSQTLLYNGGYEKSLRT